MEMQQPLTEATVGLIEQFRLAVREERLDEAQCLLDELGASDPEVAARPVYATMLALAHDDALGALQALQGTGEEHDDLRAICLRALGDPCWEGLATSLAEESGEMRVRAAMCHLLDRTPPT